MEIKYLGHSSFLLSNKKVRIVTDPFDSHMVGLPFPKVEADVVTISHQHQDHNFSSNVVGNPVVFDLPGMYEKQEAVISGYASFHDTTDGKDRGINTLFKIEFDDISILHCGDLGTSNISHIAEEIGEIDILLVPTGGFYTISAKEAASVVKEIDPYIVIPMHYKTPQHSTVSFEKLDPVDTFISEMGMTMPEKVSKLTVNRDMFTESLQVIVMQS